MAYADIQIALFTGYPNYYPYPTETPIPYPYSYPGENIRICIRIRTIRELSDPKGIRIRFSPERMETIRSVFIPTDRWLLERCQELRNVKLEMLVVIWPENALQDKSRDCRAFILPISFGILPDILFLDNFRNWRPLRFANSAGIS